MDFTLSPQIEEYRRELKEIIARVITPEVVEEQHRSGTFNNDALNLALARGGYLERAVPGLGIGDPVELWQLFNELEKAGAPYDGISITMMIAGVVNQVGTDWQKERILPSLLSGEDLVCMGYSEPDYGSDVASIVTRAERDGDEWVINGAKMWTTMAQAAKWLSVSESDVRFWRAGITVPPLDALAYIATVLKLDIHWLCTGQTQVA